jgi:hypothetical protein
MSNTDTDDEMPAQIDFSGAKRGQFYRQGATLKLPVYIEAEVQNRLTRLANAKGVHFTIENKDRSIFRKNIGRALLNRDWDPFLPAWELDRTSRAIREQHCGIDLERQRAVEGAVVAVHSRAVQFRGDSQRREG